MMTANSYRNYTEKDYSHKTKYRKQPNKCSTSETELFDHWFTETFLPRRKHMFGLGAYHLNEDAFSDTYLRMRDRIATEGKKGIDDYQSYFIGAFYSNQAQVEAHYKRFTGIDSIDPEDNNPLPGEYNLQGLGKEISDYVHHHFDIRQYELFKLYIALKMYGEKVSYGIMSEIMPSYKPHQVQRIISHIKKEVARAFAECRYRG
jgi:hypothetical protein